MYPLENPLSTNPISSYWRDIYWGEKKDIEVHATFVLYFVGMIGYAFSVAFRILGVVKDIFMFIGRCFYAICTCEYDQIVTGILVLGASIAEVVIAIIGVICPPVAYALDEHLYKYPVIYENALILKHCVIENGEVAFKCCGGGSPEEATTSEEN